MELLLGEHLPGQHVDACTMMSIMRMVQMMLMMMTMSISMEMVEVTLMMVMLDVMWTGKHGDVCYVHLDGDVLAEPAIRYHHCFRC